MSENDTRANAVREAQAYIARISRRGLVPLDRVLADLAAVAQRMEDGMTARGHMRPTPAEACGHPLESRSESGDFCLRCAATTPPTEPDSVERPAMPGGSLFGALLAGQDRLREQRHHSTEP